MTEPTPPASWTTPDGHTEYEGGTVYLLHFTPRLGADGKFGAGHYRGKAAEGRLDRRLAEHAAGMAHGAKGAKITAAQVERGGSWTVHTEPGGAALERQRKQETAARTCPEPECVKAAAAQRERKNAAQREARAAWKAEAGWESAAAEGLAASAKSQAQGDAASWSAELEAEAG